MSAHNEYTAVLHLSFDNGNYGECGVALLARSTARIPPQFAAASGLDRYTVCPECWDIYTEYRDEDDTRRRTFLKLEKRFSESRK